MSWKSTLYITRERAWREIMARLLLLPDTKLGDVLDVVMDEVGSGLYGYNFIVTDDIDNPEVLR